MVSAGDFSTKLPCTASHEGCGEVVAVGSSVKDFNKGDRVMAGIPFHRCGHCPDCLGPEEFHHYCPNLEGHLGVTTQGAFAEYMLCDARESSRIPDQISYETAARQYLAFHPIRSRLTSVKPWRAQVLPYGEAW